MLSRERLFECACVECGHLAAVGIVNRLRQALLNPLLYGFRIAVALATDVYNIQAAYVSEKSRELVHTELRLVKQQFHKTVSKPYIALA